MSDSSPPIQPLSKALPGTWQLISRTDVSESGSIVEEPSLGSDPLALLMYDRTGHFSAQFMKRDRTSTAAVEAKAAGVNNTRAQGGYDAYFGNYTVDDKVGSVTQTLLGALSPESVGMTVTRVMKVHGERLTITLGTTSIHGVAVTRTLLWQRVG